MARTKSRETTYVGGFHAVTALLESERKPREVLLAETRRDHRARRLMDAAARANVTVRNVGRSDLDLRAPGLRHQGVLAEVDTAAFTDEEALNMEATPDALLLVLDGVQDPHNLGACLRTAEAAGVRAVIVPKDRAAGLTPVVRQVAAGAAERVPLLSVTNLSRELERLKALGYWIYGLAGDADESLYDADFTGPVALVMGSEGEGLRRLTRDGCDRILGIPMAGAAESLNVSVAAAVALFEVVRQRGRVGS